MYMKHFPFKGKWERDRDREEVSSRPGRTFCISLQS